MDTRKEYVSPAVVAEDVLEQTSLACHATQPYPFPGVTTSGCELTSWWPNFAAPGNVICETNVAKGGAFGGGAFPDCNVLVEPGSEVLLS